MLDQIHSGRMETNYGEEDALQLQFGAHVVRLGTQSTLYRLKLRCASYAGGLGGALLFKYLPDALFRESGDVPREFKAPYHVDERELATYRDMDLSWGEPVTYEEYRRLDEHVTDCMQCGAALFEMVEGERELGRIVLGEELYTALWRLRHERLREWLVGAIDEM